MGEWISPIPDDELATWQLARDNRAWPTPNRPRAFGGYWFPNAGSDPAPMQDSYLLRFDYRGVLGDTLWVNHFMEPVDDFHTYSDSGVNGLGQRLQMHVRDVSTPKPGTGATGIEWQWVYDRDGFADTVTSTLFIARQEFRPLQVVRFDFDNPSPRFDPFPPSEWGAVETGPDHDWLIGINPNLPLSAFFLLFWSYPASFPPPGSQPLTPAIGSNLLPT